MTCGKIVKCYDNSPRPCLRYPGHKGGCNPFSDTGYEPEKSNVVGTIGVAEEEKRK